MPLESQYSAQVSAMALDGLVPDQVTGLQFTVEQGKVNLSWDPVITTVLFTDQFTGDGTTNNFQLTYSDIAAESYTVTVDGVEQIEGVDYTIDLVNGQVTFATTPNNNANIEVSYRQNLKDLAGYRIFRKRPSESTFTVIGTVASTVDSQTTVFSDTTALDGCTYDYAVAAIDDEETPNEGQKSATIQVKTVPSVPQGLTATAYDKKIVLRWQSVKDPGNPDLNENLAGYNIYRSETDGTGYVKIGMVADTETEFEDTTVENGRTYYYVITAFDNSL